LEGSEKSRQAFFNKIGQIQLIFQIIEIFRIVNDRRKIGQKMNPSGQRNPTQGFSPQDLASNRALSRLGG
jgi:hypothetical protein